MTDVTTERRTAARADRIEPVDLQVEMQRSYLDYAMSVIVGRALPDVRDGLKPVHRRVLYAMYDGGYRPDRGYSKCSRVVGDVMGQYHPHGDSAIYDALVRLGQPWSLRYPLDRRPGQLRLAGQRPAPRPCGTPSAGWPRWPWRCCATSTRTPSTSGRTTTAARRSRSSCRPGSRTCSSTAPPASRSAWPPTSRRTTCARSPPGSQWCLDNSGGLREELLEALIAADQGPGLPDRRADRRPPRHRGGLPHRPRLDHDARGRRGRGGPAAARAWWSPSCPTRSTPTTWRSKIAELVKDGRITGIADIRDESSLPHRAAPGHRAQARRRRQGRAEQPLQAHPAAGHLRREHAGARRRRAADAAARRVHPLLGRAPDRGHRPPHPVPAAQGAGAGAHPARAAQGARPDSTRSSRSSGAALGATTRSRA